MSDEPMGPDELVRIYSQTLVNINRAHSQGRPASKADMDAKLFAENYAKMTFTPEQCNYLNNAAVQQAHTMMGDEALAQDQRNDLRNRVNQDLNIAKLTGSMSSDGKGLTAEQVAEIMSTGKYKQYADHTFKPDHEGFADIAKKHGFKDITEYLDTLEGISDSFDSLGSKEQALSDLKKHKLTPQDLLDYRENGLKASWQLRMEDDTTPFVEEIDASYDTQLKADILSACGDNDVETWGDGYDGNVINDFLPDGQTSRHADIARSAYKHEEASLDNIIDNAIDEEANNGL